MYEEIIHSFGADYLAPSYPGLLLVASFCSKVVWSTILDWFLRDE